MSNRIYVLSIIVLSLIFTACGGGGGGGDTSHPPIFTSGTTINVTENVTNAGYTATATDSDNDVVTFGLTGGVDQARFYIDPSSGVLSFNIAPDFEAPIDSNTDNSYIVEISATDGVYIVMKSVTVTVTNLNDNAPIFTSGTTISVVENATASGYTASAIDGDNDVVTFSLTGGVDQAAFSIDGDSGALSFNTAPDFSVPTDSGNNNTYVVEITATDNTYTIMRSVTVTVTSLPISRTTDNLRVYQAGDNITYEVTVTTVPLIGVPTIQTGTLTIQWNAHSNLIRPVTLASIPVIQEVSTLDLGGATEGVVRYISQDANGKITLHALEAGALRYWLSELGIADLTTTASSTFFYSPIVFGIKPQTTFFVMDNCEGNANCSSEVGRYIDDQDVVGDSTLITTNLGVFLNPFQINFSGSSVPSSAPLPVTFDIRNVCDTNITQHGYAGNGTMYVMPEIGIIRMENTCSKVLSSDIVVYTFIIRSTNIPFP